MISFICKIQIFTILIINFCPNNLYNHVYSKSALIKRKGHSAKLGKFISQACFSAWSVCMCYRTKLFLGYSIFKLVYWFQPSAIIFNLFQPK